MVRIMAASSRCWGFIGLNGAGPATSGIPEHLPRGRALNIADLKQYTRSEWRYDVAGLRSSPAGFYSPDQAGAEAGRGRPVRDLPVGQLKRPAGKGFRKEYLLKRMFKPATAKNSL